MTPSLRTLKSFFCSKLIKLFVVHISVFIIFTLREKFLQEKSYGNLFSMCFLWITLQVIVYLRDNHCQSYWIALMSDNSLVYCSAKPKGNICNIRYYILALHSILALLCPVSKLDGISDLLRLSLLRLYWMEGIEMTGSDFHTIIYSTRYQAVEQHIATRTGSVFSYTLKVIYHPLYSMNNYGLIWGDWLPWDPLRGSYDSQSPHIWGDWLSCDYHMIANHPI